MLFECAFTQRLSFIEAHTLIFLVVTEEVKMEMAWQIWLTVGLTLSVLLLLIFTRAPSDMVMMAAVMVLSMSGILTPQEAFAGFSNSGLLTVAAMFVLAAGIRASGGVDLVVNQLLRTPKSERRAISRLMAPVMLASAFINNTPVVATMIPAVARWSKQIKVPVSSLMIPLSYASILGGTVTLIGTSTNLVVNGQYQALTGKPGFGLFDITPLGIAVALTGMLFIVLTAPRLLPNRQETEQAFANKKQFTFEVAVAANGPLVGKTIIEAGLRNLQRIYLAEIERKGHILTAVASEERLEGGDRLVFVGETDAIIDVLRINGLVASDGSEPVIEKNAPERRLVEAVVSLECECIGQTIRDSQFRSRYGAVVLAVARNGSHIKGNLGSIEIQAGDLLLLEARPPFITRQRYLRDFLVISDLNEERPSHDKAPTSWAILLGVIGLASFELLDMLNAALLGAGLMILTRCCSVSEARRSLDLTVLITIGASLALGAGLEKSGAAGFLASQIMAFAGSDPWLLLALTYFTVMLLTELITNNAAAAIMLPIVLAMCEPLGLNQIPYVVAVMFAASASFATPLGYQTNMMVYGPGGYHFTDFLRMGAAMNLIVGVVTVSLIPLLWSLRVG